MLCKPAYNVIATKGLVVDSMMTRRLAVVRWPRVDYMPLCGGFGGRNSDSLERFVAFMKASARFVVGLIVNLCSRYVCLRVQAHASF
jgi:hypothetical protein